MVRCCKSSSGRNDVKKAKQDVLVYFMMNWGVGQASYQLTQQDHLR